MGVKRATDKPLIKELKKLPCFVCKRRSDDVHHLRTRGAGGDDSPTNLMQLCRHCHVEVHRIGIKSFTEKYNLPIDCEGYPTRTDII